MHKYLFILICFLSLGTAVRAQLRDSTPVNVIQEKIKQVTRQQTDGAKALVDRATSRQDDLIDSTRIDSLQHQVALLVRKDSTKRSATIPAPKASELNSIIPSKSKVTNTLKGEAQNLRQARTVIQKPKLAAPTTPKFTTPSGKQLTDQIKSSTTVVRQSENSAQGKINNEVTRAKAQTVALASDTTAIKHSMSDRFNKAITLPDNTSASYENGKLNLPMIPGQNNADLNDLKSKENAIKNLTPGKDLSVNDLSNLKNLTNTNIVNASTLNNGAVGEVKQKMDSIGQLTGLNGTMFTHVNGVVTGKVYSDKTIKRVYDSMGISRFDTLMTLAAKYKEVSKGDLLKALNISEPNLPTTGDPSAVGALGKEALVKETQSMPGTESLPGRIDLKSQNPSLENMKLSRSALADLPPMRGFHLPQGKYSWLDSVRQVGMNRQALKMREQQTTSKMKSVVAEKYARFVDKAFVDAIVGLLQQNGNTTIQFAPSFGYRIIPRWSVGVGPNFKFIEVDKKWSTQFGYRAFTKFEFYHQRASLQFEDLTNPTPVKSETLRRTQHSVLTGLGYQIQVSNKLFLQTAVLYRVNNAQFAGGQASPWVFRVGLSAYKRSK